MLTFRQSCSCRRHKCQSLKLAVLMYYDILGNISQLVSFKKNNYFKVKGTRKVPNCGDKINCEVIYLSFAFYTRAFEERRVYYNRHKCYNIRMFAPTFEHYGFVFRLTYKLFITNCEELPKEYYCLKKIFQNNW